MALKVESTEICQKRFRFFSRGRALAKKTFLVKNYSKFWQAQLTFILYRVFDVNRCLFNQYIRKEKLKSNMAVVRDSFIQSLVTYYQIICNSAESTLISIQKNIIF